MKVNGSIKLIGQTKTYGDNFIKREIVVTTKEKYPQHLKIEFIKDKCAVLNNFSIGDDVEIQINLHGREWIDPKGEAVYFNSIQGWKIEKEQTVEEIAETVPSVEQPVSDEPDDLPF